MIMKTNIKLFNRTALQCGVVFAMCFMVAFSPSKAEKVTGLSDFTLFIDPGHALKENEGLYGYTEAEKTLRVGLAMREYLQTYTDIKNVYMCREDDNTSVTLEERVDMANSLNVDFYYSIHSDAGSADANSTLFMYGGWKMDGAIVEKTPNGGRAFGDILCPDLTGVMRAKTRGNKPDRVNYDGDEYTSTNKYPYLYVNRVSNMASLLSEGCFHTNPTQQQRNMSAGWKRMEGLSAFRSRLEYMNVERPVIGVASGIITDEESGVPANNVTVTIGDKSYTTDGFESVFNKYSKDPDQLHNGFWFIEGLTPGNTVEVKFMSPDFQPVTKTLQIVSNPTGRTVDNMSILDITMVSSVPAKVKSVSPDEEDLSGIDPSKNITITFSRKMDRASVESALSIVPEKPLTVTWKDDYNVIIALAALDHDTDYTLKIDGAIAKNSQTNQLFDGNGDGAEGGIYSLAFRTSPPDTSAPVAVSYDPADNSTVTEARPIIRIEYDEAIDETSVGTDAIKVMEGANEISGIIQHTVVAKNSVLHFIPSVDLVNNKTYTVNVAAGIKDLLGNAAEAWSFSFTANPAAVKDSKMIDAFETLESWWEPAGAGQTAGIIADQTSRVLNNSIVATSESRSSLALNYGWDVNYSGTPMIRLYLPSGKSRGTFTSEYVLQAYVFGDASNNDMMLVIRDGKTQLEGSGWIKLNWRGWKLITWDMSDGKSTGWINGDGNLDGTGFYFDCILLQSAPDCAVKGTVYFDDLCVRKLETSGVDQAFTSDDAIRVYLTPTVNELNIEAGEIINDVAVYSLSGSLVKHIVPSENKVQMNMDGLAKGVYIVKAKTTGAQRSVKVVVM